MNRRSMTSTEIRKLASMFGTMANTFGAVRSGFIQVHTKSYEEESMRKIKFVLTENTKEPWEGNIKIMIDSNSDSTPVNLVTEWVVIHIGTINDKLCFNQLKDFLHIKTHRNSFDTKVWERQLEFDEEGDAKLGKNIFELGNQIVSPFAPTSLQTIPKYTTSRSEFAKQNKIVKQLSDMKRRYVNKVKPWKKVGSTWK